MEERRESRELDTRGEELDLGASSLYNSACVCVLIAMLCSRRAQAMFMGTKSTTTKEGATIFEVSV